MITNNNITIYHKIFDEKTRLEVWKRFNYNNVWAFGGKGSHINKGYDNANDINIRIDYNTHDIELKNFAIGDIIVKEELTIDIKTQQDLPIDCEIYNITTINNNDFGTFPHIHIGGK